MGEVDQQPRCQQQADGFRPQVFPDLAEGGAAHQNPVPAAKRLTDALSKRRQQQQRQDGEDRNPGVDVRLVADAGQERFGQRRDHRVGDQRSNAEDAESLTGFLFGNEVHDKGDHPGREQNEACAVKNANDDQGRDRQGPYVGAGDRDQKDERGHRDGNGVSHMKPGEDEEPKDERRHRLQSEQKAAPSDGNVDGFQVVVEAVKNADIAERRHDDQGEGDKFRRDPAP